MKQVNHRANPLWILLMSLFLKISEEYAPDPTGIWWVAAAFISACGYWFVVWREAWSIKIAEEAPVGRQLQWVKEVRILKWIVPLLPLAVLIFLYRHYFA